MTGTVSDIILHNYPQSPVASVAEIARNEPQGLTVGQHVSVTPDVIGGEQAVEGMVRMADANTIAIDRISDTAGAVCVHFPRAGYRVETG